MPREEEDSVLDSGSMSSSMSCCHSNMSRWS